MNDLISQELAAAQTLSGLGNRTVRRLARRVGRQLPTMMGIFSGAAK